VLRLYDRTTDRVTALWTQPVGPYEYVAPVALVGGRAVAYVWSRNSGVPGAPLFLLALPGGE